MITIRNLHKSFGTQTIFDGANLQINGGDRYAVMGPNGSGKSTLLRMLMGMHEPDSGELNIRRGVRIGYLPQETAPVGEESVLSECLNGACLPAGREHPEDKTIAKAKSVLMGLGFRVADFEKPLASLSGGWAMRVAIARLLIQDLDCLMLDEPTNHLDLESMLWFQEYLQNYRGILLLISHDRAFVNALVKGIIHVDKHQLKLYPGDYENFVRVREQEAEQLLDAYKRQQREIADHQEFINRFRAQAAKAKQVQSRIKMLEKMELIELPEELKKLKIKFPQPVKSGVRALLLQNISKSYGDLKVYEHLNFELERGQKMAFVGHNGAGKSTLLKLLAGVLPFESGQRVLGHNVRVGYYSQHRIDMLTSDRTVFEEAMDNPSVHSEQVVRTVLGSFLFRGNAIYKKVNVLSGGEKSRLALVKFLLDPPNVLLMDEPTTHLDMNSVEALIEALKQFEGTLCFISHDLHFLNSLATHIVHVDKGHITLYPGNYEYFQRRHAELKAEQHAS